MLPRRSHGPRREGPDSPINGLFGKETLLREVAKATILAVMGGLIGYISVFIMPPGPLYDRWLRQDPNKFEGRWTGQVGGWNAQLDLKDVPGPGRLLTGTLTVSLGGKTRKLRLSGNHDANVNLQGAWDDAQTLKIGLIRTVGERFGPDADLLKLERRSSSQPAVTICPNDTMDITNCPTFFDGDAFFSHKRGE